MKKTFYFIYSLFLIYFLCFGLLDYSNLVSRTIEKNKVKYIINQPNSLTNSEFINELERFAKKINTDLLYVLEDSSEKKLQKKYYVSMNTPDFLGINNIASLLKEYKVVTNNRNNKNDPFYLARPGFYYDIYIYNFADIVDFNLQSAMYYVEQNKVEEFLLLLEENKYSFSIVNERSFSVNYLNIRTLAFPFILLLSSIIYFVLSQRKDIVIKKLMGYRFREITLDLLSKCFIDIALITFAIGLLFALMLNFYSPGCLFNYMAFMIPQILFILFLTLLCIIILNFMNVTVGSSLFIKNRSDNYSVFYITLLLKFFLVFIFTIKFSVIILDIENIYNLNKINTMISKQLGSYVSFPINASNNKINSINQLDYNKKLDIFYEETVDKYNGILINTRNYSNAGLMDNDTLAFKYNQISITVNENYLKINPIHEISGNLIDDSYFDNRKLNLLLPKDMESEDVIRKYMYSFSLSRDDFNIMYYKKGEIIRSFNPYSGRWDNGIIHDPIIEIYNKNILKNKMLNYVSGQYYFIKIGSDNAYKEISPLLKKLGLEGVMLPSIKVSNVFDNSISDIRDKLILDMITGTIYFISMTVLILYTCKLFVNLYIEHIMYKKINGYNILMIYFKPLGLILLQYVLLLIPAFYINLNFSLYIFLPFEFLVFLLSAIKIQSKKVVSVIRGEYR